MLDVGLGVRLAAAPAPPVPAPPGKSPLPLSSSSLRRRSSSWWFSNSNAHGRDATATATTTTTTSSRATRRWWWSDPDGSQQDYGSSALEDDDYDSAFAGFGWAEELFDESWFSKVFKTYGVILPVMLTSMFAATGLKAFLMAMAIPLSQSAISFLLRRKKGNRNDTARWRIGAPFQEEYFPEDATDFATGGRGNGYSSSSSSRRRQRHNYQSWVSKDFADAAATSVGSDGNTKSSSRGDGWGGNKSRGAYGGWDELLNNNTTVAAQEAKRTKSRPPERMRMRRRRVPRTMGLGRTRYRQAPTLMRWLVALFPFLRSWFRLL